MDKLICQFFFNIKFPFNVKVNIETVQHAETIRSVYGRRQTFITLKVNYADLRIHYSKNV